MKKGPRSGALLTLRGEAALECCPPPPTRAARGNALPCEILDGDSLLRAGRETRCVTHSQRDDIRSFRAVRVIRHWIRPACTRAAVAKAPGVARNSTVIR
jgi:hypothetical protein